MTLRKFLMKSSENHDRATMIAYHKNSTFSSMSYRLYNTLIDSGDVCQLFDGVVAVLLTHAHFDHIYGLNELLKVSPTAKVYTNESGRAMLMDVRKNLSFYHETPFVFNHPESIVIVKNRCEINLDNGLKARALFTPGHNPSCITWIIGDAIFTGDSYIPGIKTVTNLPKGNKAQALKSEELIKSIAIGHKIYPGHEI